MRLPSRATSTPWTSPVGTLTLSSVPSGSGTSSSRSTTPRGERGGVREVERAAEPEVHLPARGLLGDGDARDAEHDALQRGRHRARVGDVVAQVGAVVDAGDDQVGLEALDQPERGEPDAVHRRAVAGVAHRAVAEVDLGDPQRAAERDRPRPVAERLPSGAITASWTSSSRDQRAPQRSAGPRRRSRRRWSAAPAAFRMQHSGPVRNYGASPATAQIDAARCGERRHAGGTCALVAARQRRAGPGGMRRSSGRRSATATRSCWRSAAGGWRPGCATPRRGPPAVRLRAAGRARRPRAARARDVRHDRATPWWARSGARTSRTCGCGGSPSARSASCWRRRPSRGRAAPGGVSSATAPAGGARLARAGRARRPGRAVLVADRTGGAAGARARLPAPGFLVFSGGRRKSYGVTVRLTFTLPITGPYGTHRRRGG